MLLQINAITSEELSHLYKLMGIIGGFLGLLTLLSFPLTGALYRVWSSRVEKCVTVDMCGAKHQATVDLLKAHLEPINEKLTKLCNGVLEYESRISAIETYVEMSRNKRKGDRK